MSKVFYILTFKDARTTALHCVLVTASRPPTMDDTVRVMELMGIDATRAAVSGIIDPADVLDLDNLEGTPEVRTEPCRRSIVLE